MKQSTVGHTAKRRVKKGVAWLDRNVPGWEDRIKIRSLDMGDGCKCVLGQVFNKVAAADPRVGAGDDGFAFVRENIFTHAQVVSMGFDYDSLTSYGELSRAWKAVLKERQVG